MLQRKLMISVIAGALALGGGLVVAADQTRTQQQTQAQEQIYGSQLMTQQERLEYRNRMRAAKTTAEREKIRLEHHERMQALAKERGITLPDVPTPGGAGMGPGGGMRGGGMGPGGGGMGPGGGRGR